MSYGATHIGRDGAIVLLHRDGTVLARVPHVDAMIGAAFTADRKVGANDAAGLADGGARLSALSAVEGLPLLVVATASVDETLAAWKQGMQSLSLVSLLSAVVGVAFALLLIREFRRRDEGVSALAASESRFRDFAGTASDWLWESDEQHRVTWFSKRGDDGNPAEWMPAIGKTRWDNERRETDPEKWAAHRDDLDNRRPFRNFEYWALDRDGNRKHIRVSGTPVVDEHGRFRGYRGTSLDVTAEVEARAEAERANARLLDAIESLSDGFALFNADDRLVDLQPGLRRLSQGSLARQAGPQLLPRRWRWRLGLSYIPRSSETTPRTGCSGAWNGTASRAGRSRSSTAAMRGRASWKTARAKAASSSSAPTSPRSRTARPSCRHALPSRTPSPSWRSSHWSRSISTGCSPRRPT